jgi:hypothetical protein
MPPDSIQGREESNERGRDKKRDGNNKKGGIKIKIENNIRN